MMMEANIEQWKLKALRSLSSKQQTTKELTDRLTKRGCPEEFIDEIIDELTEMRALDDYKYAYQYTNEKIDKGYSRWLIEAKLREKGVPTYLSNEAYDEYCHLHQLTQVEIERNQAYMIINSMAAGGGYLSRKDEARMLRRLRRYGHQIPRIVEAVHMYKDIKDISEIE